MCMSTSFINLEFTLALSVHLVYYYMFGVRIVMYSVSLCVKA